MGDQALATVVVVPRQRFSQARGALEMLFRNTPAPFPLVYVDGGSPPRLGRWLEGEAARRGFRLIRTPHYLSPNEARNRGAREVRTRYVVFVDNDVLVAPGWLAALVRCAEETGAWVVGPLVCIGRPPFRTVHIAGGLLRLEETPTGRRLVDKHRFGDRPLAEVRPQLRRGPCDFVELHCALVRTEALRRIGPLDEQLLSAAEHFDLALSVTAAGGTLYFEPAATVNYLPARWLRPGDVGFYMLRWSEGWNRASLQRLREKWGLAEDDPFLAGHYAWLTHKRMLVLGPPWQLARRLLGWRRSLWAARMFERVVTRPLVLAAQHRRAAGIALALTAGDVLHQGGTP